MYTLLDFVLTLLVTYLALCPLCFISVYGWSVDYNGRLPVHVRSLTPLFPDRKKGFLKEVFRLLYVDLFRIHCPWSWEVAVQHRVAEVHRILLMGRIHERGWRPEDCHNLAFQQQIAKSCFSTRAHFWCTQLKYLLFAPIRWAALQIALFRLM